MGRLSPYEDALMSAVMTRFSGDIRESLKWGGDKIELSRPVDRITIPLRAEVSCMYDKGLAGFTIEGRVHDVDNPWHISRAVFSSLEVGSARQKVELLVYLFEELKDELFRCIAERELDEILGRKEGDGG